MFTPECATSDVQEVGGDKRRHPRKTVFKSALLYPVLKEASLTIANVSSHGVSGRSALDLNLREHVHISFNSEDYLTAEVRWTQGERCGLLLEDPLLWLADQPTLMEQLAADQLPRESRMSVDMQARVVTSAPVMVGTIRNMSAEGMMVETHGLREGTRLLVKSRDRRIRMGRVRWSSSGMVGLFFEGGI
ncbi:PilZ domain-containing protein [Sphingobium mellinum]|uniref:PilZ domain-containing protein n=1 Tax=Sphingobium mellinum TaxID=1387166 RepID=UPI0030EE61F4